MYEHAGRPDAVRRPPDALPDLRGEMRTALDDLVRYVVFHSGDRLDGCDDLARVVTQAQRALDAAEATGGIPLPFASNPPTAKRGRRTAARSIVPRHRPGDRTPAARVIAAPGPDTDAPVSAPVA